MVTLHQAAILDELARPGFDRLTRLAAQLLHVPNALVALVDGDALMLAGRTGEAEGREREVETSLTLCRYVTESGQPFVTEDARTDPVSAGNAALANGVVTYAGVPLTTREGTLIGTLCVYDAVPRAWTAREMDSLHDLAGAAMTEISLRHELHEHARLDAEVLVARAKKDRADEVYRKEAARHLQVLNSLPVIVYRSESVPPFTTMFINAATEILGYSREEWMASSDIWKTRLHPDDREWVMRLVSDSIRRGEVMDTRYRIFAKDGTVHWVHDRGEFVMDERGAPVWQGVARDITAQRVTEEALRSSEERFRLAGQATQEVVWDWDMRSDALRWSDAVFSTFCYQSSDVSSDVTWWYDNIHPDDTERVTSSIREVLDSGGTRWSSEYRFRRGDGSFAHVLDRGIVARNEAEVAVRMVGSMIDITSRIEAAEALRFQAHLLDIVGQAVIASDLQGRVTYWNRHAELLFGWASAEAMGRNAMSLTTRPEDAPFTAELLATVVAGEDWAGEQLLRRRDGSLFAATASASAVHDSNGRLIGSVGVIADASERRQLEEQLRQSQKMEAVGRLAGGVAHDFNNLLTVIKASTDFLLQDTDATDPRREDVRHIADASERAAALTRQLLAFSRKQILRPSVTNLNTVVTNLQPMLTRLLGEDLKIETALAPALGSILADVGQIEQVLVNLAVNARDAMPTGGRVTITTSEVTLDEPYAADYAQSEDAAVVTGRYVLLTVSDTGVGMSAEVKARAFEPFFTTKGDQQGTGLGLATVYGIVKQSGGHVWVYSEPGEGTVFKLYFPRIEAAAVEAITGEVQPVARGSETILVVEDEDALRSLTSRMLERTGYTVLQSRNGAEALAFATQYPGVIHAVLTDVVMPQMSGRGLAERLRAVRPRAKVLFMSGYTDDDVLRRGLLEPGSRFLQKPFSSGTMLELVRATLDEGS